MLNFYKSLTQIKKLYGNNATYQGHSFSGNNDIYHFSVTSSNGTFYVYINTGNTNQTVSVPVKTNTYALNGARQDGTLTPFGVIVTK